MHTIYLSIILHCLQVTLQWSPIALRTKSRVLVIVSKDWHNQGLLTSANNLFLPTLLQPERPPLSLSHLTELSLPPVLCTFIPLVRDAFPLFYLDHSFSFLLAQPTCHLLREVLPSHIILGWILPSN